MAEGSIRGGHDGAALIPIGDHLEEELGPLLVHREIDSNFAVNHFPKASVGRALFPA